ncbi:MAG: disulfide bond formation protein B [Hyphomonadaceae bacterium]|jgi:disulfide bond formation protein DsbB|nr:disulfide bond formation protein B [Hyphomonadaceae bacterium]
MSDFLDRLTPWPLFALIASLTLLAIAHAFEHFGGMAPCALCLKQREAYWIAAAVAAVALILERWRQDPAALRAMNALLVVAFMAGAVVAGFHAGVEQKWWPGLATCVGGELDPDTDLLSALQGPMNAARCDEIPWAFAGISMAGWNMVAALILAGLSLRATFRAQAERDTFGEPDSEGLEP